MSKIHVVGGSPLKGSVSIPGGKNAVLPILAATLLTKQTVKLHNVPRISDVENMVAIMRLLGCEIDWENGLSIDTSTANCSEMPEKLAKELRSSIFMLGPMVGRFKRAKCTFPGGCEIGNRPIDLHLKGLSALNVVIEEEHGYIICNGEDMRGAQIHLDYPSVGATENIMMAAVAAKGRTTIHNAAREPEIAELERVLKAMGAKVHGAGSSVITIDGGGELGGTEYTIMPDRITAGTFMVAAAITGGDVQVRNVQPEHLHCVLAKLKEAGCALELGGNVVSVKGPVRPNELHMVETLPYPGFPTDMQSQLFSLCTLAAGTSVIVENVFENRFKNVPELTKMGANIMLKDRMAVIRGVKRLTGAQLNAQDLRGGAALVLAALAAKGESVITGVHSIDRGYERFEEALAQLGAQTKRIG